MSLTGRIAILGAGSIGCYVGGRLLASGSDVVLIGRESLRETCATRGMTVTDWNGFRAELPPGSVHVAVDPTGLRDAGVVLLAVKSKDTAEAASEIKAHAPADALVISLQNGVRNAALLRELLPQRVLAGVVAFNVVQQSPGHFHCGTEGELLIERTADDLTALLDALRRAGLPTELHDNMVGLLWGKLLMNLNNPLVALTGMPLADELRNRLCRRVLAMTIAEALQAMRRAKIVPEQVGKVPARWLPHLLRLPNFLFVPLARSLVKVDPAARSSMWEDLQRRRLTEIDYLNGEVLLLGRDQGLDLPLNRRIVELVKQAEQAGNGSPQLTPEQLFDAVRAEEL